MNRRTWAVVFGTVSLAGAVALAQPPAASEASAQVGQMLPGPFRAYIAHGNRQDKFHDPIDERGLNPTVAVFVRTPPPPAGDLGAVTQLLQRLNALVGERISDRFGAFAMFLWLEKDYLDDDKHEQLRQTLSGLGANAKLDKIELGLEPTNSSQVQAYKINPKMDVTVIVYDRMTVRYRAEFGAGKPLDAAAINAIIAEAEKMLSAVKKRKKP